MEGYYLLAYSLFLLRWHLLEGGNGGKGSQWG